MVVPGQETRASLSAGIAPAVMDATRSSGTGPMHQCRRSPVLPDKLPGGMAPVHLLAEWTGGSAQPDPLFLKEQV